MPRQNLSNRFAAAAASLVASALFFAFAILPATSATLAAGGFA